MTVQTADVRAAIARSSLAGLPVSTVDRLLGSAVRVLIPARATILSEGGSTPHFDLVLRGLVRVQVSARDGRMWTVRYGRPGDVLGAATLYSPVVRPFFSVQAISDAELLRFRPEVVRHEADRDLPVALALLTETSERVMGFVGEFSSQAFASVRERVAHHLLDLALEDTGTGDLVAPISQQALAEAVGSVREVVVRALRELRDAGAIATGRGGILITDPGRLVSFSGLGWNRGS
ncbi:Crp/Fnr family transcriptional regulator [Agromyces mariniharenae]|uniref:Crp/Fnr family transcriptional regulator n=1 Tax=Agromyces mariniharenae TaxID=2604423 RepID=A0A5S4V9E7_9MICO|nr:Crp/Fnr family transcriptional regulator [Agromyces mariniharenae]TYL53210.1 Crp/Fnr family transcriptional regulator [Agromyces mariniharenae]